MKKILGLVLLFVAGGLLSGFISTANTRYSSYSSSKSSATVFPVAGKRSVIGSFWGAVRDGGKRKHEGIDIFARKGTPVVAVSDGVIVEVGNTPRGGKTVWLRSSSDDYVYYYAHLDRQLVQKGQSVTSGQQLGTLGNTGNAKLTPPHLHFGMYSYSGAVNPLPYVKNLRKVPVSSNKPSTEALAAKPPVKTASSAVIDKKYIWKSIDVPMDRGADYYVTIRSNVVRVENNKLTVVGKYRKTNNSKFPYSIVFSDKRTLNVTPSGKVVTAKGQLVGTIS